MQSLGQRTALVAALAAAMLGDFGAHPASAETKRLPEAFPAGCKDWNGNPRASLTVINRSEATLRVTSPSGRGADVGPGQSVHMRYALGVGRNVVYWDVVRGRSTTHRDSDMRILVVSNLGAKTCSTVKTLVVSGEASRGKSTILVNSAMYGVNCPPRYSQDPRYPGTKDVTTHLARACNGKTQCSYHVNHRVIGDPAYGCPKTLRIDYQCAGGAKKHTVVPAEASGRRAMLNC